MTLENLGESGIIGLFQAAFAAPKGVEGIGDDCAVIPKDETHSFLVSTDILTEDTHFRLSTATPFDVGYKSVMVNLSDIAAMGGVPKYLFLNLALPKSTDDLWLIQFSDGFQAACKKHGIQLLGGDTVRASSSIFIGVTVLGLAKKENIKLRSSARANDLVFVCGNLGDSAAGLEILEFKKKVSSPSDSLIEKHQRPEALVLEGEWFGKQEAVGALMDISDGLLADMEKLCKASGFGTQIDLTKLPISEDFSLFCSQNKRDASQFALQGGEDYALLGTCDRNRWFQLKRNFEDLFSTPLVAIGGMQTGHKEVFYLKNNERLALTAKSYKHF